MGTRGFVKIGDKHYFISSDAYPSYARRHLKSAVKKAKKKTASAIVAQANKNVGSRWIRSSGAGKKFRSSYLCEYGWEVKARKGTVKQIRSWKGKK